MATTIAPAGLFVGESVDATSTPTHQQPKPFPTGTFDGAFADGATWTIRVPTDWNGTLLLFSHGLVPPGENNPAEDAPDPVAAGALLAAGYALAGSSYATTGFAVEDALHDQRDVLDVFRQTVGAPKRTIAWGSSLGGMLTAALLERSPQSLDGGLSMCGVLAGSVGLWNSYLDELFVLRTFLAPDVDLVKVDDPFAAIDTMRAALEAAQQTPEGRARIALAAAVADVPGWIGADNPRPDPADVATQEEAQFQHFQTLLLFGLALRADMEARAGGNPSSNVDVDYAALLRRSNGRREVRDLYAQAGLDLRADLATLAAAPDHRRQGGGVVRQGQRGLHRRAARSAHHPPHERRRARRRRAGAGLPRHGAGGWDVGARAPGVHGARRPLHLHTGRDARRAATARTPPRRRSLAADRRRVDERGGDRAWAPTSTSTSTREPDR